MPLTKKDKDDESIYSASEVIQVQDLKNTTTIKIAPNKK